MSSVISQTRVLKDTPLKFNGYSGPFYVDDVLDYINKHKGEWIP